MRDVIVIGGGGGGPVVAKELAARGLDVLLLEAGPGFTNPERDWSHYENEASNPVTGIFRFGPADRSKPAWRREMAQNSTMAQVSGLGGTTKAYFANSPRSMPGAFVDYSGADAGNYDNAHLFPLGYRELIPYYEWVEQTLPVETAAMGTKEEIFFRGASQLGLPVQTTKDTIRAAFRPQENAILQPRGNAGRTADPRLLVYPQAGGCTFCGHCAQGCTAPIQAPRNLKAKRSTDASYIPMATTADLWTSGKAANVVTDAFVMRINTDETSTARSVTWRVGQSAELVTEEARVIVLAAGAIESPRLWLNSGLPNPNDWVGRGLTDHFLDLVVGVAPFYTGSSKGPGSAARVDFPGYGALENACEPPGFLAYGAGLSDAGTAGMYATGYPGGAHGAETVGRLAGPLLKSVLANLDRLLHVIVITDDHVEPHNRVMLSSTSFPDEHGPIARIEISARQRSARTLANREYLAGKAVQLLRNAGAQQVHRIGWPPLLLHSHGTLRMGTSAVDSVLDSSAEARWVPRLFVADNSALANGLGGMNPTLTTQALATQTAEKIFQRYFGGHPWVRTENPISSIDSAVTAAVLRRRL